LWRHSPRRPKRRRLRLSVHSLSVRGSAVVIVINMSKMLAGKEMNMKQQRPARALAAALMLSALNWTIAGATDVADEINPGDFTVTIDNPFFPLPPGVTFIYRGNREGRKQRDEFAVTNNTIVIAGVTCRVVHDRVFLRGILQENTFDYFAQDRDGN